jgi:subtilisin family serine protease
MIVLFLYGNVYSRDKCMQKRTQFVSIVVGITFVNLMGNMFAPLWSMAQIEKVGEGVRETLSSNGEAYVVIALKEPPSVQEAPINTLTDEIASLQDQVLSALSSADFRLKHRYQAISALTGWVTEPGLEKLMANPSVVRIDLDVGSTVELADTVPLIYADVWHTFGHPGITGKGIVVAILDTGLDTNHVDLVDDLIAEACFLDEDGRIDGRGRCPNGSDRQEGPGAAQSGHFHGTFVTGIITSRGTISPVGIGSRT